MLTAPAATTDSTLSLHDALPISRRGDSAPHERRQSLPGHRDRRRDARRGGGAHRNAAPAKSHADLWHSGGRAIWRRDVEDRKSTRLNSSHGYISYAVLCL